MSNQPDGRTTMAEQTMDGRDNLTPDSICSEYEVIEEDNVTAMSIAPSVPASTVCPPSHQVADAFPVSLQLTRHEDNLMTSSTATVVEAPLEQHIDDNEETNSQQVVTPAVAAEGLESCFSIASDESVLLQTMVDELKTENQKMTIVIDKMVIELDRAHQAEVTSQSRVQELTAELDSLRLKDASNVGALAAVVAKVAELEGEMKAAAQQHVEASVQLVASQAKCQAMQNELADANARQEADRNRIAELVRDYEAITATVRETEGLKLAKEELLRAHEECSTSKDAPISEDERREWQERVDNVYAENVHLQQLVQSLVRQVQDYTRGMPPTDGSAEAVLRAELAAANTEMNRLRYDVEQKDATLSKMNSKMEEQRRVHEEAEANHQTIVTLLNEEIDEGTRQTAEKNREIEELRRQVSQQR